MAEKEKDDAKMSFLGHLEELRWRLFRMAIAVVVLASVVFVYTKELVGPIYIQMADADFVTYKMLCNLGKMLGMGYDLCTSSIPLSLQSTGVTSQFGTNLYFAIVSGIVVAFPYISWNIWKFVKPALHEKEQKAARGFIGYSSMLFILGIAFGYFIISPLCIKFFGEWTMHDDIHNNFTISSYMTIITTTTFFTALIFQLPIVAFILAKAGLVTPAFLKKYRKHAIVVVLILSAIITPPDILSQIIVAIPIAILYEISIVVARRVEKKRTQL